jgi:hypothetical protein
MIRSEGLTIWRLAQTRLEDTDGVVFRNDGDFELLLLLSSDGRLLS